MLSATTSDALRQVAWRPASWASVVDTKTCVREDAAAAKEGAGSDPVDGVNGSIRDVAALRPSTVGVN